MEVWDVGGQRVLAVTAAAYPGETRGLQGLVQGVFGETLQGLEADAVASAVTRVRAGLLAAARTPTGLAGLVGRYVDATGEPAGAAVLLEALDRVDLADMRAYLGELEQRTPVRAEVRP